jgi:chorismate mutase
MKEPEQCRSLSELREIIDEMDEQIILWLAKREKYVKRAAGFKPGPAHIKNQQRNHEVLEKVGQLSRKYGLSTELANTLYELILQHSIEIQTVEWNKLHNK